MKKLIAILLVLAMVLAMSGCGVVSTANAMGTPVEETQPEEKTLLDTAGDIATVLLAEYLAYKVENWLNENVPESATASAETP